MLTLLWGLMTDPPLAMVRRELRRIGAATWFLDQRAVLGTSVSLEVGVRSGGCIRVGGAELDLADVGAAYLRPHESTRVVALQGFADDTDEHAHAAAVDVSLATWADVTPAYVVNRPCDSAGNGSKPYQLRAIAAAGFGVPETLVTNDPEEARGFAARYPDVVVKSISGVRSRVRTLDADDLARLPDVVGCPVQLQQWVPGTDVRVHVAGAEVFATEVACAAVDYRYAADQGCAPATLRPCDLPDDVARRCRWLAAALRLPVAGIDLRRSDDGRWFCFEVNPSPAFSYYEAATGQPIAAAIAGLLAAAALCASLPDVVPAERRPAVP
jgi:glutathione synthase/RimK-type ligase-like ATP-grasp enzyme